LVQKFEVSVPTHARSPHVALDDFNIDLPVRWNHNGAQTAGLGKNHVVALLSTKGETILLEHTTQLLMGNGNETPFFKLLGRFVAHGVPNGEARSRIERRFENAWALLDVYLWAAQIQRSSSLHQARRARSNRQRTQELRPANWPLPFRGSNPGRLNQEWDKQPSAIFCAF
jgi:hypothetical protein